MPTFAQYLKDQHKAALTIKEYERRLHLWKDYLDLKRKSLKDATTQDVLEYRKLMMRAEQSARTINAKMSTMAQYYNWLVLMGEIETSPVPTGLHLQSHPARIKRLSDTQLRTVYAWFDGMQANLRAAFYTLSGTGARVGEVAKLTHSDVSLEDGRLYIDIRDAKWGSDRKIPVVDPASAVILYAYWRDSPVTDQPLFRLSKRTIQSYATAFAEETGIPFYAHLLRHTFASKLLEQGVPMTEIQYLLGHKSVAMTAHYTQSAVPDTSYLAPTVFQQRGSAPREAI